MCVFTNVHHLFTHRSIWIYDLDLLHSCANPALRMEISNFGYVGKNGG